MGVCSTIDYDNYPKQGDLVGKRVLVCFNYDTNKAIGATCVRDDREHPYQTIFLLDDGRYVLATECMYSLNES